MARSKAKGCDFCNSEHWGIIDGKNGHNVSLEIYPETGLISISSAAKDENGELDEINAEIKMRFCPICGTKLTGE